MIIHLKRFDNYQRKIRKFIKYDEYLNLSKITKDNLNENIQYKLCSMLIHKGSSIDSGHYYSFVRTSNNDWYIFNDHSVTKADRHNVLNQKPYLLFYEKLIERVKRPHKSPIKNFIKFDNQKFICEEKEKVNPFKFKKRILTNLFDQNSLIDHSMNYEQFSSNIINKRRNMNNKNENINYYLRDKN